MDWDWLIVGGGLHGGFIADALLRANPAIAMTIVDPAEPLAAWSRRADACGMVYLRSSNAHHLGARANSLRRFAARQGFDAAHELGYYRRPSRLLFESHARATLRSPPRRLAAFARHIQPYEAGWCLTTATGDSLTARHVVLATGPGQPYRPPGLAAAEHVFDLGFTLGPPGRRTAIVGGGITGAQLALQAIDNGHSICWVTRTPPRSADFDSEPRYAGRLGMAPFLAAPISTRTQLLRDARRPGTLPPDILARITVALSFGRLTWQCADVADFHAGQLRYGDGRLLHVERVILATGFEPVPDRQSLIGRCIEGLGLATDTDGHVVINDRLEAAPGLHITGRPASLELGPMAGNVKGARMAGQRLAALAG